MRSKPLSHTWLRGKDLSHSARVERAGQAAHMVFMRMRAHHMVNVRDAQRILEVGIYQTAVGGIPAINHEDAPVAYCDRRICLAHVQKMDLEARLGGLRKCPCRDKRKSEQQAQCN